MKIIQGPRAAAILYRLLVSQKRKRRWLLPANICPVVPETFVKAGVPFAFVDISRRTLQMDLDEAEARLMVGEWGGLLYAHTYGAPNTPETFFRYVRCLHPEMLIVDDRCLCVPEFDVSSSADVVLFSTGYRKVVDLNFGGYAFIKEHIRLEPEDPHAKLPSWEAYRNEIEEKLQASLMHRAALNEIYASCLPGEVQLEREFQQWRFNIRLANKSAVMRRIFDSGLFASSHYSSLAGVMSDGRAPEAESLATEVINLFNDHHFDTRKAERVCEIIRGSS